jgi:hypothetical protein
LGRTDAETWRAVAAGSSTGSPIDRLQQTLSARELQHKQQLARHFCNEICVPKKDVGAISATIVNGH